eukprot:4552310-Alexandrium_andersonii.AAC.1
MSASLVGSEMCIRDSVAELVVGGIVDAALVEPVVRGNRQGVEEDVGRAVSYTHLTLPTICSV